MKALTEILRFYGMPEDNIDMAINQIAQGYGACRFLEGVEIGAKAVSGQKNAEEIINEIKKIEHGKI